MQCLGQSGTGLPTRPVVSLLVHIQSMPQFVCSSCKQGLQALVVLCLSDDTRLIAYLCYSDELGRRVYPDNLQSSVAFLVSVSGELLKEPNCQIEDCSARGEHMQDAPDHRHVITMCKGDKHAGLRASEHLAEDGGELERGAASSALQVKRCGAACLSSKISEGSAAPAELRILIRSTRSEQQEVMRLGVWPTSRAV